MEKIKHNWSELLERLNNWEEVTLWFTDKIIIVQKDWATEFNVLSVYLNPHFEIKFENGDWDYQVSIPSIVMLRRILNKNGVDFE